MQGTHKALTLAELQALSTGIPKYFPNFGFLIASTTYTTAEVMIIIKSLLDLETASTKAKTAAHDAIVASDAAQAQHAPFIKELRQFVVVAYSNASTTLADFAIAPRKPRVPLSNAARAAAEAKAKATRLARGTKGSKQKAKITGNVTGVTITPTTSGAPVVTPSKTP